MSFEYFKSHSTFCVTFKNCTWLPNIKADPREATQLLYLVCNLFVFPHYPSQTSCCHQVPDLFPADKS